MDAPLYNTKGETIGSVSLPESLFGMRVNRGLLHEVVTYYRSRSRVGTVSTKTRAEVRGGGAKPWRQKGTGRARQGSIRSPLWRKGGIIFGPKPHDFSLSIPKKKLKMALAQSLSAKFADGGIKVVDSLDLFSGLDVPVKTKSVKSVLDRLGIAGRTIVVKVSPDEKFMRAAQNIPKLSVCGARSLNAYEILAAGSLVLEQAAISHIGAGRAA